MTYKRVLVRRTGGPEVLEFVEEALPEPQPGQVRLKILTAGVAFGDVAARRGDYPWRSLPFSPGYDIVGVVDKLGPEVTTPAVGQRVGALPTSGGYAEFICLPAAELVPVPDGLDPAEAVSVILNYVTANQMLHRVAQVKPGERILVHSAAGGVGTALLQLGRLAGLNMYGTASQAKHALVSSLGATPIDYRNEDFVTRIQHLTGDGVDVVFDSLGGDNLERSYRSLRPGGRLVAYGYTGATGPDSVQASRATVEALQGRQEGRTVLAYGISAMKQNQPAWFKEDLQQLFGLLAQRHIQPVITARLPLAEVTRAHELLEQGAVSGKIVLYSKG